MSLAARIACGALILVALVGLSGVFQLAIVEELSETASGLAAVDVEALALGLQLFGRIDEVGRRFRSTAPSRTRATRSRRRGCRRWSTAISARSAS